jgi:hypothetical protein
MGIDPWIIVFFPPLGGYALLGNLVICLSGQVTLALSAIETTDSNQLHVPSYMKTNYIKYSAAGSDNSSLDEVRKSYARALTDAMTKKGLPLLTAS